LIGFGSVQLDTEFLILFPQIENYFSANAVGITLDMKARNFPVLKNAEISIILSPNFTVQSSNFSLPRRVSPAETRSSVNSEHSRNVA
jgi:hypothetical protein